MIECRIQGIEAGRILRSGINSLTVIIQCGIELLSVIIIQGTQEQLFRSSITLPGRNLNLLKFLFRKRHILVSDSGSHRQLILESSDKRILIPTVQCIADIILLSRQDELIERPEPYVYVTVLKKLIIEILLGEFSIQRKQRTVFPGSIRK